jgi:hypothetical protein
MKKFSTMVSCIPVLIFLIWRKFFQGVAIIFGNSLIVSSLGLGMMGAALGATSFTSNERFGSEPSENEHIIPPIRPPLPWRTYFTVKHTCQSERSLGHSCVVGGMYLTQHEAWYGLSRKDCCPGTRKGGVSIQVRWR